MLSLEVLWDGDTHLLSGQLPTLRRSINIGAGCETSGRGAPFTNKIVQKQPVAPKVFPSPYTFRVFCRRRKEYSGWLLWFHP